MVTPAATTDIFYPETDGMPLPDGDYQLEYFIEIIAILKHFFRNRFDVWVSGNTFLYYVEGDPRLFVSPDCYVAFGVDRDLILSNNNYRAWDMGKAPDFILEIGSPSTWRQDLGDKRDLYARLGVVEYWMFDPSGGDHYGFALRGETPVDGEYRELDMARGAGGDVWGYSPVLNLELHWQDGRLWFYDPVEGRWLENTEEAVARAESAEARAQTERSARESAEARAESAEARTAELEAELRRLRGQ